MPVSPLSESDRTFEGWASVEVVDKQKDLIPVTLLKNLFPIYMSRGGHVSDGHTNRHIGKIDSYKVDMDPSTGKPGVYVKGHVFKDYTADDDVWNKIKKGEYAALSFGGREIKGEPQCDSWGCFNVMKVGEMWELALVPRGANQNANITKYNEKAKGMTIEDTITDVQKGLDTLASAPEQDIEKQAAMLASLIPAVGKLLSKPAVQAGLAARLAQPQQSGANPNPSPPEEEEKADIAKHGHEAKMSSCVAKVKAQGKSEESAKNICGSSLFQKMDVTQFTNLLNYGDKVKSEGRALEADRLVASCPVCKSQYVSMLDTMTPTAALREMQKQLDTLKGETMNDTKKQNEEIPAGAAGAAPQDPLQMILAKLGEIEQRLAALEGGKPAAEGEVMASATGEPVKKAEPEKKVPLPQSQKESAAQEINENAHTETVKMDKDVIKAAVREVMKEAGYVRASTSRPATETRVPVEVTHEQVEKGEPVQSDNWREVAKGDWKSVHEHANKVLQGGA